MDKNIKPKIFIGSSVESLPIAYALQTNLEYLAEPTVWTQGIFRIASNVLKDLDVIFKEVNFAAFIFSPDDCLKIRGSSFLAIRDNVLFELGMAFSALGQERVFIIKPRDVENFHFPTDLAGLITGAYEPNRRDSNLIAALGPVSHQITQQMEKIIKESKRDDEGSKKALTSNLLCRYKQLDVNIQLEIHAVKVAEPIANFLIQVESSWVEPFVDISVVPCSHKTLRYANPNNSDKSRTEIYVNIVRAVAPRFPIKIEIGPPKMDIVRKPMRLISVAHAYSPELYKNIDLEKM